VKSSLIKCKEFNLYELCCNYDMLLEFIFPTLEKPWAYKLENLSARCELCSSSQQKLIAK